MAKAAQPALFEEGEVAPMPGKIEQPIAPRTAMAPRSVGARGVRQRARRFSTIEEKLEFWTIPEPNSGCLLWTGAVTQHGYVRVCWLGTKRARLNRLLWKYFRGPIPEGLHVLHRCDVRSCANVNHYFLGTNADNVADKIAKGRGRNVRGEQHGMAVLSADAVQDMRRERGQLKKYAERYGVTETLVSMVQRRKIWRHVA